MAEKEVARKADLGAHVKDDWKTVHGIWVNVRDNIRIYTAITPTALTLTNDNAWHDLSLAAYVPTTVTQVRLWVRCGATGRWVNFYFGPAGTTGTAETASVRWSMTVPVHKDYLDFPPLDLALTSQTMAYKTNNEAGATVDKVFLTGWWKRGM